MNARAFRGHGADRCASGNDLPLTPLCLAVTEGVRLDYRPSNAGTGRRGVRRRAASHAWRWSVTRLRIEKNSTLNASAGRRNVPRVRTRGRALRHIAGRPEPSRRLRTVRASNRTGSSLGARPRPRWFERFTSRSVRSERTSGNSMLPAMCVGRQWHRNTVGSAINRGKAMAFVAHRAVLRPSSTPAGSRPTGRSCARESRSVFSPVSLPTP